MKHLTKVRDLTRDDVQRLLADAFSFKAKHDSGVRYEDILGGKVIAMVFEKPSLRTKVAFEVAATYLGGHPVFLSSHQILASGNNERGRESLPDIARNLERFADLIIARVYNHEVITQLVESIDTPVVNALCDSHHPTQALADLMVIRMHKPDQSGLKVAYVGDGTNVATSLMQICALEGHHFSCAAPKGYQILQNEQEVGAGFAAQTGSQLAFVEDPKEAAADADVVYTDTFLSMGLEEERAEREQVFEPYQVNSSLMGLAKPEAVFMHCLPAHRGEEVTDEVMDSKQSIVFDQAECRLHIAKALLCNMLNDG